MKRFLIALILIMGSMSFAAPSASAAISDCVDVGSPAVSSTSTSITIQVSISVNCTNIQLGQNGGSPRYSIVEENTTSSSCNGPETFTSGQRTSARCTIRMGGESGSARAGATTSTMRISYRSDSSFKLIPFTHIPITDKVLGDGGGSTTNCKFAPATPKLSISYLDANSGPRFDFSTDPTGDSAKNIFWTYSTYDSVRKSWDAWNSLTSETVLNGVGSFVFQSNLMPNKSKIAFYAYASNACGSSPKVHESVEENGIPLAGKIQNSATLKMSSIGILDTVAINDLITVSSNNDFTTTSRTPNVCIVSAGKIVPVSIGICVLSINAPAYFNVTYLQDFNLNLSITRNSQTLSSINFAPVVIGGTLQIPSKTDQGIDLIPEITTNDVCKLNENTVIAVSAGNCSGQLKNSGNDKYLPFVVPFSIDINKMPQKIQVANLSSGLIIKNRIATLDVKATSNLPVSAKNLTPGVCQFNDGKLAIVGNGLCNFELAQVGDSTFAPAPKITIKMTISNFKASLTITCVKGKLIKQVTGAKPVCPAGFKKR